jgi:hypothetical protein
MNKPLVCVVGTGGTIASRYDAALGGHVSAASASDLVSAIPELSEIAEIRIVEHSNINSALMDTPTAFGLRDTLRKVLKDDGKPTPLMWHELAHILTPNHGHDDVWRAKMHELGQRIPMRYKSKKKRAQHRRVKL